MPPHATRRRRAPVLPYLHTILDGLGRCGPRRDERLARAMLRSDGAKAGLITHGRGLGADPRSVRGGRTWAHAGALNGMGVGDPRIEMAKAACVRHQACQRPLNTGARAPPRAGGLASQADARPRPFLRPLRPFPSRTGCARSPRRRRWRGASGGCERCDRRWSWRRGATTSSVCVRAPVLASLYADVP